MNTWIRNMSAGIQVHLLGYRICLLGNTGALTWIQNMLAGIQVHLLGYRICLLGYRCTYLDTEYAYWDTGALTWIQNMLAGIQDV